MRLQSRSYDRFAIRAAFASVILIPGAPMLAQTASSDAETRMQWLKSRVPVRAEMPTPATPTPAPPKVGFRSRVNGIGTRPVALESKRPIEAAGSPRVTASVTRSAPKEAPGTPAAKAPPVKPTTPKPVLVVRTASKVTATASTGRVVPSTQVKSALAPAITAIPPSRMAPTKLQPTVYFSNTPAVSRGPSGRYPWKTNIVTTVFWIGEKPSGNNLTPNHASSWDMNWAQNYGGYDDPDPAARRNYIPVRFTPRQNPFYVALPYNDVTRGTTKPESRRVIPWFRQAFQREGQSVCRDRWVAIRSRSGRIAYAQWSDCGPFRTDHWQYVFGNERPKPNLNKGAGLDVSPAVRDYLGLSSTDVTDWKFVDLSDVPHGPWALYGQNNALAQRNTRSNGSTRASENSRMMRVREL